MRERLCLTTRPPRTGAVSTEGVPHECNSNHASSNRNRCLCRLLAARFSKLLPAIERRARITFRHLRGDDLDEAMQEITCNACLAYARLVDRGRADAATPSSLVLYAAAQFRDGRRVGSPLNIGDVCSVYCQRRKGVKVQPLSRWNDGAGEWRDFLVADKNATPADLAASRIDFPAFLATLSRRDRRLAEKLATGESTSRAARLFGISAGRVSQLRQELKRAWERFHEPAPAAAPA